MDTPDMSHKKLSVSSAPPGPANPIIREIDRYKFGEKGFLLPFYTTTLVEWFEYCANLGKSNCEYVVKSEILCSASASEHDIRLGIR